MVDKLIIDAVKDLKAFAKEWRKRAHKFTQAKEFDNARLAHLLASEATETCRKLNHLLGKDKILDVAYDELDEKPKRAYA